MEHPIRQWLIQTGGGRRLVQQGGIVLLALALLLQPFSATLAGQEEHGDRGASVNRAMDENGLLDKIDFGNEHSENAHNFRGEYTTVTTGLLGERARVSHPREPAGPHGGDLIFTMQVDPHQRNYFTVKFAGEAASVKTMLLINGEQIGFISYGDHTELINAQLPNRFYYHTSLLPLHATSGKETIELTIRPLNPSGNLTASTRGFYQAYTHTQAYLDVTGEPQGYKLTPEQTPERLLRPDPTTEAEKQALVDGYIQEQIDKFLALSSKVDAGPGGKLSIIRYQDELKFYANVLKYDWSPAQSAAEKRAALERIFKTIDNHVKDYYNNYRLVLRGGHQGDWGGYYGALGEALYIAEKLIFDEDVYGREAFEAYLDEPFDAGTGSEDIDGAGGRHVLASLDWEGGELTRREAWERTLKANFDFARTRLSYIYNQMLYTYEGAWEAHVGLGIIGSDFYEGPERSRQILLESLGIEPFLGEEVLVGPAGEELDLYHSLFLHDGTAEFTDDYVYKIGKGLAQSKLDDDGEVVRRKPYGEHYYGLTEGGLTRENGFVANYGEAVNYLVSYFYKTWNKPDEEETNDRILKAILRSAHARGYVRYTSLQDGYRIAVTEQMTDERGPSLAGFAAYSARVGSGITLQMAYLEKLMADHEERYSGPEWEVYWDYAREAVGYAQQQMADRQLIPRRDFGSTATMSGINYLLRESYHYITGGRADYPRFAGQAQAGVVLPHTDFDYYAAGELVALGVESADYEQFAWTDIDNLYVSMRDGDVRILGALNFRNRGGLSNGRLHVVTSAYDRIVQVATNNKFRYEDYSIRPHNVDWDFQIDRAAHTTGAQQALVGEEVPITYQPGVGTVVRDNLEVDTPYSGYPDLLTARYGEYFFIFNTTRDTYGNEDDFEVELPSDFAGSSVLDLVSEQLVPVADGKVTIGPRSTLVLKLGSTYEAEPKPSHVDVVNALAGNGYAGLSWKIAAGAETYTIKRSESEQGPYTTIATGVEGFYYKDTTAQNGKTYYYKVAGVNRHGEGWESWRAKADLTQPASGAVPTGWRDDRIGTTAGSAAVRDGGSMIVITGADGDGLAQGEQYDDYHLFKRDIRDSLHYVSQVAGGNSSISARIDSADGAASGLLLRDRLTTDQSRYVYFGADEEGRLVLQNRTRNSFVTWAAGTISPYDAGLQGYTVADYPHLKLAYDYDTQMAHAFVSADGAEWQYVTGLPTLLTRAHYIGLAAAGSASFSEVETDAPPAGGITLFFAKEQDRVTLHWNKPKQASRFHLYRTADPEASLLDPELTPGSAEPVEGSPWTLIAQDLRDTTYQDVLRHGTAYYKLLPVHADGSAQPFYAAAVGADTLEEVLARAESYRQRDYTRLSFYLYRTELARIKTELDAPGPDVPALVEQLYRIAGLLVPLEQTYLTERDDAGEATLFEKLAISRDMVIASANIWSNPPGSADTRVENGWRVFDGDLATGADTQTSTGWVRADLGSPQAIRYVRFHPRSNTVNRINGGIIQGSLDGNSWTNLHTISGVTLSQWYAEPVEGSTAYRYYRYYDGHGGHTNIAELELHAETYDTTLLGYLLEQAEAAVEAGVYTEASYVRLAQQVEEAQAAQPASQAEVDELAGALQDVLEDLEIIEGMPVIKPVPDRSIVAGEPFALALELVHAAGDVEYRAANLPEGAVFDGARGTLSWTPGYRQGGIYPITFTAQSGELLSTRTFVLTVVGEPAVAPQETRELTARQSFTYTVEASDGAGKALVMKAIQLPVGAQFSPVSQRLTWTPGQADYGSHQAVFEISNGVFTVTHTLDLHVALDVRRAADFTQGSYHRYAQELQRIETAMQAPGADKQSLAAELAVAEGALTPWDTLYTDENKLTITKAMVTASSRKWGTGESENDNAWAAFDGDPGTSPDTTNAGNGWVRVDLGEGQTAQVDVIKFLPRSGNHARMNGGMLKGSLDGVNYTTLYSFSGIDSAVWHAVRVADSAPYRFLRYEGQNANVAELQFFSTVTDKTLLELLIGKASAIDPLRYTAASTAAVEAALAQAQAVYADLAAGQDAVDTGTGLLLDALEQLERRGFLLQGPEQADRGETVELSVSLLHVTEDIFGQSFTLTFDPGQLSYVDSELTTEAWPEMREDTEDAAVGKVAFVFGTRAWSQPEQAQNQQHVPVDDGAETSETSEDVTDPEESEEHHAEAVAEAEAEQPAGETEVSDADDASDAAESAASPAYLPGADGEHTILKLRLQANVDLTEDTASVIRLEDIVATGEDGSVIPLYGSASYELQIRAVGIAVTGVSLSREQLKLEEGEAVRLSAIVLPAGAADKQVVWHSSDPDIASVDAAGLVTAHKAGDATITATTVDGGYTAQSTVNVTARPVDPPVDPPVHPPTGPPTWMPPGPVTPPTEPQVEVSAVIRVEIVPGADGVPEATVMEQDLQEAITAAADGVVTVSVDFGLDQAGLRLRLAVGPGVDPEERLHKLLIQTDDLTLALDGAAVRQSADNVMVIRLGIVDPDALPGEMQQLLGASSAYRVDAALQDESKGSLTDGLVRLQLPYVLGSGEAPVQVVLYAVADDGTATVVKNAWYDADQGYIELHGMRKGTFAAVHRPAAFADMERLSWAQEAVSALAARDIVQGIGDRRFDPHGSVTRAEFAAMLVRAFDLLDLEAEASYADSREGDWHYRAIASAARLGLVNGQRDGYFGAQATITRQDMAVMVDRALTLLNLQTGTEQHAGDFTDESAIAAYAVDAVARLRREGLVNGMEDGSFSPYGETTRAQAAALVYRLLASAFRA
ncbi:S-layer homology domain-containing protein [Paenibacillus sp. 1P07SE]|uniref:S-layer homology domain-containing protein n=1 Tax=Paenibacillus sp. 1P07SE TaxID=3132209 RepID=UPI0039A6A1BC